MQKQLDILEARFGKVRTEFKLGSVLTDFTISKETGNLTMLSNKISSLSDKLVDELTLYRDIYSNDMTKLSNEVLNEIRNTYENLTVETPKLIEIRIPEILGYYIDNDIITKTDDVKMTSSVSLPLPKDLTLSEFLPYGSGELEGLTKIFYNGFSNEKLIELYTKYFSSIASDNKDLDKLLACRLNGKRGYLWDELIFVFVTINSLLKKDSIGNVTNDKFSLTLQTLRKKVIYVIYKNITLYENFINDETVITGSTENGIVTISRNLNKALNKDIDIDIIYGAGLTTLDKSRTLTISDLIDKSIVYESRWRKEYDLEALEIRNTVLRTFKTVFSKHANTTIDNAVDKLKIFGIDKDIVKSNARKYIINIDNISEDNIEEISGKFITDVVYVTTGLKYFTNKIAKYRSSKYGFEIGMAINLAVNEVCTEVLVNDLIIKA